MDTPFVVFLLLLLGVDCVGGFCLLVCFRFMCVCVCCFVVSPIVVSLFCNCCCY